MSNYCACSGGDEEYTIELNQQGPEGPQGPVGPEGYSPSISVKTNTDKAYILTVVNKEGNFDTPNLYGELEKLNADLSNIPNPAYINGVSLSSIEDNIPMITMDSSRITTNVDGNLILNATASNEETMEVSNYEVVVNPKEQRLELHDNEGNIKVVAVTDEIAIVQSQLSDKLDKATYEADKATYVTKEELASTDATVTSIQTELGNKLESSNIIAGTNVIIERSGNNLTISSTGGEGGAAINDSTTGLASTWSSSKINSEITTVANTKNDNIFDISKFKVVGSPTITDDGVASGFSSSNYIQYRSADSLSGKSWDILQRVYWDGTTTKYLVLGDTNSYLRINALKTVQFNGYLASDNTQVFMSVSTTYTTAGWYYLGLKFEYSTGTYTIYGGSDLNNLTTFGTPLVKGSGAELRRLSSSYYIQSTNTNTENTGSIDLKNFSITVDGELVFNSLMDSTKPIYDKLSSTSTELSTFKTDTDNNFSAVNSALNEKANLSDLAGYVTINKYNELLARVVALETEINGGNA